MRIILCRAILLAVALGVEPPTTQAADAVVATVQTAEAAAKDQGWPRVFKAKGHEIFVHQPQVEEWKDYQRIVFRSAIVVGPEGKPEAREYGVIKVSAATRVDFETRLVLLDDRKIEQLRFPGVNDARNLELKSLVLEAAPPAKPMTMSLDRLLAGVERSKLQVREANVNLDPPPIHYSDKPAILVMFAGKPRLQKAGSTELLYAINTNWDVFYEPATRRYFLLNGDHWLTSADVTKGPWSLAKELPPDLSRLPSDENWKDVRDNLPGKVAEAAPEVVVTTGPAEIIITDGPPQFEPISGTDLMQVANTESSLFMHAGEKTYYFLTAGRWFKAKDLRGSWAAATTSLPEDFRLIPEDSPAGDVLASVAGTPQAEEAVIQATIPQKATVKRADTTVTVVYQGEPKFVVIEKTQVQYAVNTSYSVFLVGGKYYCCHSGIWFVAPKPTGAWIVCDSVPAAIYTIPATHPTHNVTYVYVYDSTPDTVVVGSTGGYSGQYVTAGVLLFGAGVLVGALLDDDDNWHCHYHSCYFSYGCGARYHYHHGGFYAGGYRYYGPYGGGGGWAAYNPATGFYSRGAYRYGPNGAAGVRTAYNPWTGVGGAQARVTTPYGSWGRTVISDGDDWVRAGHRSGPQGSVAGIQGSGGAGAVKWENRYGNGATVVKDKDGDVYVGKNGEIYKRDDDGGWSQRQGNQWTKPENAPTTPRPRPATTQANPTRPAPRTTPAPSTTDVKRPEPKRDVPAEFKDLDREARSRDRGSFSADRGSQRPSAPSRPSGGRRR